MKKQNLPKMAVRILGIIAASTLIFLNTGCRLADVFEDKALSAEYIKKGAELYGTYCAVCHGAGGEGYLADEATALSNQDFLASATDAFILDGILKGRPGTAMSAWSKEKGGALTREDALFILRYIRSWQKEPSIDLSRIRVKGDPQNGMVVYRKLCVNCHGENGEGAKGVQLNNPVFQETASDGFIRYAIENGRRGTPMAAYKRMIDKENIDDLVAFVRTFHTKKATETEDSENTEDYSGVIKEKAVLNPGNPPAAFTLIDNRYVPAADVYAAYMEKKSFIIIDARPTSDYLAAHIKGAISIPFYDIDQAIGLLPQNLWIIAYCACPHALSGREFDQLKDSGYDKVGVLDEGIFYWINKGYPAEGEDIKK